MKSKLGNDINKIFIELFIQFQIYTSKIKISTEPINM